LRGRPSPSRGGFEVFAGRLSVLACAAPGRTFLAGVHRHRGDEPRRLGLLAELGDRLDAPMVAVNEVFYHAPERRPLADIVTCIREKCTIAEAGLRLAVNAERHLKAAAEMARLFAGFPDAIARSVAIADACTFSLGELKYEYPDEPVPPGKTAQGHLEDLTWAGAANRYPKDRFPDGVPAEVRQRLSEELAVIARLDYARYFLTVHDVVAYARNEIKILCQGRGSAANSAVCYCLGITEVNPNESTLLFARFISENRNEPPDIDVDFEHERREEVIQYIYRRYGRDRAAICATVIHYRSRRAIREVGKVLGLTEDVTAALAKTVWGYGDGLPDNQIRQAGLDPLNPQIRQAVDLAAALIGFPRHLSQHVGGFVLTREPLDQTVPIGHAAMDERTFIEWDKDDIDTLGLMKVDVLALGMLSCLRRGLDLLKTHYGRELSLATIPKDGTEDAPEIYAMLSRADSVGVFQVESRAQMSMLPRLKPQCFYDLVIEVAIVRPGPIQGDMVHPYLRRRDGIEQEHYPSPAPEHGPADELKEVLKRTLGVPLFQEQAMQIAITAAKFTPDEADGLRRAMATFRHNGTVHLFRDKFIDGMTARGYDRDFAEHCFGQIEGFGEYGFPESHAASFALLVYASAWIKCRYPEVFCAAIINSQPMGFYQPAQLIRDARQHGVEIRAADVNYSNWDCTLEQSDDGKHAVRLGFRLVHGLSQDELENLVA
ncbi:MAG TPA: error-prone DNA polymerase, partial [Beijerinckiaceae bacterium]|nr:error-prone DNA polymerase [Beijerinckiaceae bacterium]